MISGRVHTCWQTGIFTVLFISYWPFKQLLPHTLMWGYMLHWRARKQHFWSGFNVLYIRYFKHLYHLGIEPRPPEQESYMIPLHWLVCWYSWAITHIPLDAIAFFQSALALSWGKCIEKDIIHNSFTACLIRSGWLEIYDEPLFLLGL